MATSAGVSFTIDASGAKAGATEIATAIGKIQQSLTQLAAESKKIQAEINSTFNFPNVQQAIRQVEALNTALQSIKFPNLAIISDEFKTLSGEMSALGARARILATEMNAINVGNYTQGISAASASTKQFGSSISETVPFLKTMAFYLSAEGFMKLGEGVYHATQNFQSFQAVLNAVADNSAQANEEIALVSKTVFKLGLDMTTTQESFGKFFASAKLSGTSIDDINTVFKDMSSAMTVFGLSTQRQQYVWLALEQMFNKGTIQMQELKRQLGDQLPAAFEIMAKSVGKSTAELTDMVTQGKLSSKEVITFAEAYVEAFGKGLPDALKRASVGIGELKSAWQAWEVGIGTGGAMAALSEDLKGFAAEIVQVNKATGEVITDDKGLPQLTEKWRNMADQVGNAMKTMFDIAKTTFTFVAENAQTIGNILEAYLAVKGVKAIIAIASELTGAVSAVKDFGLALAGIKLADTMAAFNGLRLNVFISDIGAAAKAIWSLGTTDIAVTSLGKTIDAFGSAAAAAFTGLSQRIGAFVAVNGVLGSIKAGFLGLASAIGSGAVAAWRGFTTAVTATSAALLTASQRVGAFVATQGITGVLSAIAIGFRGLAAAIWTAIAATLRFMATPIGAIITAIVVAITTLIAIWDKFRDAIVDVLENLPLVGGAFKALIEDVLGYKTATQAAKEETDKLNGGLGELSDTMKAAVENARAVGDTVTKGADGQLRFTRSVTDAENPLRRNVSLMDDIANGASDVATKVVTSAEAMKKIMDASKASALSLEELQKVKLDKAQKEIDDLATTAKEGLQKRTVEAADLAEGSLSKLDQVRLDNSMRAIDAWANRVKSDLQSVRDDAVETARVIGQAQATANNMSAGGEGGGIKPIDQPTERASGGPTKPGMVLVGEQGPEIIMTNSPGYVYNNTQTQKMLAGVGNGHSDGTPCPECAQHAIGMARKATGGTVYGGVPTMVGENGVEAFVPGGQFSYTRSGVQPGDNKSSSSTKNDMAILPQGAAYDVHNGERDIWHYASTYKKEVLDPAVRLGQVTRDQETLIMTIFREVADDWKKYKARGPAGQVGIAKGTNGIYPYFSDVRQNESLYGYVGSFISAAFGQGLAGDIENPWGTGVASATSSQGAGSGGSSGGGGGSGVKSSKKLEEDANWAYGQHNLDLYKSALSAEGLSDVDIAKKMMRVPAGWFGVGSVESPQAWQQRQAQNNQTRQANEAKNQKCADDRAAYAEAVYEANMENKASKANVNNEYDYFKKYGTTQGFQKTEYGYPTQGGGYKTTTGSATSMPQEPRCPPDQPLTPAPQGTYHGENYATGGEFIIPPGGAVDSRMVQFMGSPGEHVKISPASHVKHGSTFNDDENMGGGGQRNNIQINLHGISDFNSFRRSERQMMSRLNRSLRQAQKNV